MAMMQPLHAHAQHYQLMLFPRSAGYRIRNPCEPASILRRRSAVSDAPVADERPATHDLHRAARQAACSMHPCSVQHATSHATSAPDHHMRPRADCAHACQVPCVLSCAQ